MFKRRLPGKGRVFSVLSENLTENHPNTIQIREKLTIKITDLPMNG